MSAPVPQIIPPRRSREQSERAMRRLKIGLPDWDKLQPEDGFPPLKKVDHPEAEWNEAVWPPSGWPEDKLIAKGKAEAEYLVKGADLDDLVFLKQHQWIHESKKYRIVDIQRRAWEKYGGPSGLEAAKAERAVKRGNRLAKRVAKPEVTPARGRGEIKGRGRGRARGTHTPTSGRNTGRGRATPPIPQNVSVQAAFSGLLALSPPPISAVQSLSASPSLATLTRRINSQQHDDPQPSGVVAALDNLAGSSGAAPPRDAKRWRESGGGPGPSISKRQKVFRIAEDSDEESPLRTSAPDFYPTLCQSATTFPEVIEIVTDDDEFGSLRYHSVIPKKRIWKTKKTPAVVLNDEVIEISD